MKTIIQVQCPKCRSKGNKIGGVSWPKCCGVSMILDETERSIISDPKKEYRKLK